MDEVVVVGVESFCAILEVDASYETTEEVEDDDEEQGKGEDEEEEGEEECDHDGFLEEGKELWG